MLCLMSTGIPFLAISKTRKLMHMACLGIFCIVGRAVVNRYMHRVLGDCPVCACKKLGLRDLISKNIHLSIRSTRLLCTPTT